MRTQLTSCGGGEYSKEWGDAREGSLSDPASWNSLPDGIRSALGGMGPAGSLAHAAGPEGHHQHLALDPGASRQPGQLPSGGITWVSFGRQHCLRSHILDTFPEEPHTEDDSTSPDGR